MKQIHSGVQNYSTAPINLMKKLIIRSCYETFISALLRRISLFLCRASHVNLAELAVIWTHYRDVRGMGPFPSLRHKVLCNPVFKEILHCKAVRDVKSRIDPCLSLRGRRSKSLLVLITCSANKKLNFEVTIVKRVCFPWRDQYCTLKYLGSGAAVKEESKELKAFVCFKIRKNTPVLSKIHRYVKFKFKWHRRIFKEMQKVKIILCLYVFAFVTFHECKP